MIAIECPCTAQRPIGAGKRTRLAADSDVRVLPNHAFDRTRTYTWQAAPDGSTRMGLRNRGNPSGFSRLFAPFMASAGRRANRKDLARLKGRLERSSPVE